MKKKLMALLLCLVMVVTTLAACGGGQTSGDAGNEGNEGSGDATVKATVFWYEESDVYLSTVRTALNKELETAGIAYDNQFAGNDQAKQIDQIKTAIAGGSNLLIVNIVTSGAPDTAQDIIDIAGDIPVIFFNRAIGTDGSDVTVLSENPTACFIGTDAPEAGHMQGKMVGDYVLANYDTIDLNGDGVISYAMMKGQEGNVEAEFRTQFGVEDANAILTAAGKSELAYFDANNTDCYQVDLDGAWSAKAAKEYFKIKQKALRPNVLPGKAVCFVSFFFFFFLLSLPFFKTLELPKPMYKLWCLFLFYFRFFLSPLFSLSPFFSFFFFLCT